MTAAIVADGSVSCAWVLRDEQSHSSRGLAKLVSSRVLQLVVPGIWWYEMLNALRSAIRRNRIDEAEAREALSILQSIPKEVVSAESQGPAAILETALRRGLSAYDAAYFHLAESRGLRLVSADRDLLRLQGEFPWIRTIEQVLRQTTEEDENAQ